MMFDRGVYRDYHVYADAEGYTHVVHPEEERSFIIAPIPVMSKSGVKLCICPLSILRQTVDRFDTWDDVKIGDRLRYYTTQQDHAELTRLYQAMNDLDET